MQVPLVDLKAQYEELRPELEEALLRVLRSGQYVLGPEVEAFEGEFARFCGVRFCVACNSGTSALHLALRALGIGPGDEVITVSMSFVATAWAISYTGARPVFVDIHPRCRTLNPQKLLEAITPRTRAIVVVHLYGQGADMEAIYQVAQAYRLPVVEDAAQAHGATIQGRPVGSWGHLACFSFYPSKNLGACGEGGAVTTSEPQLAQRLRMLRDHAQLIRGQHETLGYNYRMNAMQGAVLRVKLKQLLRWNAQRARWAKFYHKQLQNLPGIRLPAWIPDRPSVWHLYVVEVPHRDLVLEYLRLRGIGAGVHYPQPIHLQRAYRHLGYAPGSLPATEHLAQTALSLPLFPHLTRWQAQQVCRELGAALWTLHHQGAEGLAQRIAELGGSVPDQSASPEFLPPAADDLPWETDPQRWLDRATEADSLVPWAAHAALEGESEPCWQSCLPSGDPTLPWAQQARQLLKHVLCPPGQALPGPDHFLAQHDSTLPSRTEVDDGSPGL